LIKNGFNGDVNILKKTLVKYFTFWQVLTRFRHSVVSIGDGCCLEKLMILKMMRSVKAFLILMFVMVCMAGNAAPKVAEAAQEEHGLPSKAGIIFDGAEHGFKYFAVTSSMVVTILVTIVIVAFAQVVSRNVKPVPEGAANFMEWIVESLYNFLGGILGEVLIKKTFWFFCSLFLFILVTNWIGLIPGVGTVGWGHYNTQNDFHVTTPLLRGGNADLNMTSAMALLFFVLWIVWALQANGPVGFVKHLFAPKGKTEGFMKYFMIAIFLFVGVLEVMSIAFRPVSLSFRLFGNVFAGENILESMMNLVPWLSWLIPLPFYFLELLVGLVQALVFTLLTSVFTLLICEHEHEDHGEHGKDHEHGHGETGAAYAHH
jgi:F-type H+-transporting ATPase subunit a